MNTTLIMNASEGRIQFVLEQEGPTLWWRRNK